MAKFCAEHVKAALTQNQVDALASFIYNLGSGNFSESTLLRKLNQNPCDPSIRDEFMRWTKAKGVELAGLKNRRAAEANLYFSV